MATILKYQTASGATRYAVRYRTPEREQTMKRGFVTKRDAQDFANGVEVDMQTGVYVKPSRGKITAAELAPEWLERKKQVTAPSHYRMLESAWRVHVAPRWGAVSVADIDVVGIESWISAMVRDGAGATTVLRPSGCYRVCWGPQ
jgi:hypothetical protein